MYFKAGNLNRKSIFTILGSLDINANKKVYDYFFFWFFTFPLKQRIYLLPRGKFVVLKTFQTF